MIDAYRREAALVARQCWSHWNRDPASPSFGCFDRPYWGWKKKDIADTVLQAAITPALRLAEDEGATETLPALIDGYVAFVERIQHRNGSFDQMYPHEGAPGVVYDILSALIVVWRSPHVGAGAKRRLEAIMHRAVDCAVGADEKHGEIANHFASFAWELMHYGQTFDRAPAVARARYYLDRTLKLFRPDEGWFLEYDGADAGYQTRTLAFLTKLAAATDDAALWGVCAKAARFVETMLMPDGSLHPMLGVRSTATLYPSGFERLADRDPAFAALADRVHAAWAAGLCPTPSTMDLENGLRLADDALEAMDLRARRTSAAQTSPALTDLDLSEAGLHRRAVTPRRTLFFASKLGGCVVVYDGETLRYEDAGYLLRLADGSIWLQRRAGAGEAVEIGKTRLLVECGLASSLHEDLTPLKLVLLRVLNLTVLRSQWLGDVFRKLVVRRLISGRETLALRCRRSVTVDAGAVVITDRLEAPDSLLPRLKGARLYRCRRTIANHMATSRYFQPQELSPQPWVEEIDLRLGEDMRVTID